MGKGWLAVIAGLAVAGTLHADDKPNYAELSRLIQQAAAEKCPKKFEDTSEWGRTIPIPPAVRFPRLQRVVLRVNGRDEVPDGVWRRTLVWLDDPAKDIQIRVLDVQKKDANNYLVTLAAEVAFHGERERKRWRNGVQLFGLSVQADARIRAEFDCAVKIAIDATKLPPEVVAEPKVVATRLELRAFDLNRVGNILVGDPARDLGDELKGVLQDLLKQREGEVKDYANQALAKALKGGQARIPLTDLLKLKPRAEEKGKGTADGRR